MWRRPGCGQTGGWRRFRGLGGGGKGWRTGDGRRKSDLEASLSRPSIRPTRLLPSPLSANLTVPLQGMVVQDRELLQYESPVVREGIETLRKGSADGWNARNRHRPHHHGGQRLPNRLTVSGVPSQGDGQGESQRSNLDALALCLDVLPPAPPVTALITLCKLVTMADNWSNKQEDGHASHRRSGSSLRSKSSRPAVGQSLARTQLRHWRRDGRCDEQCGRRRCDHGLVVQRL